MQKILVLIACLCLCHGLHAQDVAKTESKADIKFENTEHDFGTIKQGGNGTYNFIFKNTGTDPLIISNAQGSCGCTVPKWPHDPIMPGASDTVKTTYDTKRIGGFTKTVTITSNAKTSPVVLTIKGMVEEPPKEQTMPFRKTEEGSPFERTGK